MYVFLFICVLLTPVSMFAIGAYWAVKPPKKINSVYGYRTPLSCRSQESWDFAHYHISRLWLRLGLILGIISAVLMVVFRENYQSFSLWIIGGQMLFMCVSVFLVDTALKNGFDENGKPL